MIADAIMSGTLDSAQWCGCDVARRLGSTHRESYFDITMAGVVGPILPLVIVIILGSTLGSF